MGWTWARTCTLSTYTYWLICLCCCACVYACRELQCHLQPILWSIRHQNRRRHYINHLQQNQKEPICWSQKSKNNISSAYNLFNTSHTALPIHQLTVFFKSSQGHNNCLTMLIPTTRIGMSQHLVPPVRSLSMCHILSFSFAAALARPLLSFSSRMHMFLCIE